MSEQDLFIVEHYSRKTYGWIAEQLGIKYPALQAKVWKLQRAGLLDPHKRKYNRPWRKEDEEYLVNNWGLLAEQTICTKLRRTQVSVRLKAKRLGVIRKDNLFTAMAVAHIFGVDSHKVTEQWIYNGYFLKARKGPWRQGPHRVWIILAEDVEQFIRNHPLQYDRYRIDREEYPYWRGLADKYAGDMKITIRRGPFTEHEDEYIVAHYRTMTPAQIGKRLRRLPSSVKSRAGKLRQKGRPVGDRRKLVGLTTRTWTREQDEYLCGSWGLLPDREVAFVVGHTVNACEGRARRFGINRTSNRARREEVQLAA